MKIRTIITDRSWKYRLHILPQQPGSYYVCLRSLDGAALNPAAITGSFPSLDAVVEHAEKIYLHLVAMREANSTALPAVAQQTAGQTPGRERAATVPVSELSGHPGIDRFLC